MSVDAPTDLACDIARLTASIDGAAKATETALIAGDDVSEAAGPSPLLAEGNELSRQLTALRERVARARDGRDDPRALRSELATLLFFARTLEDDADRWRAGLEERLTELERQRAVARREQERLAAERAELVRRRDRLQSSIVQTATSIAALDGGECRNTLPIFTLGAGATVCSVSVSCPRRGLHVPKHWLVTLNGDRRAVSVRRA